MIDAHWVVFTLLGYIVFREISFHLSTHELINKLMSRNYHEFKVSKQSGKMKAKAVDRPQDMDIPEDLRILQGFTQ